MGRLIDADTMIDKYGDWYTEEGSEEGFVGTLEGVVDMMPTIEPEVEAISVSWIETEIKKLRAMDFEFATLTAEMIEAMLKKWREEQNEQK